MSYTLPYRDFQARLALKQDNIRRKSIDNNLSLISIPTDTLRVHFKRNDEQDLTDMIIEKSEVIPVVFPTMANIPLRKIGKSNNGITVQSLVTGIGKDESINHFKIRVPYIHALEVDDLLMRVFVEKDTASLFAMQVIEKLGTLGGLSIITYTYNVAPYTGGFKQEILDVLQDFVKRRLKLQF